MLALGLPIGLSLLAVGGFFAVLPMLMASLGAVAIAGHAVAITVDTLMLTIPLGVGQAMSVRVAHELGGGNPRGGARRLRDRHVDAGVGSRCCRPHGHRAARADRLAVHRDAAVAELGAMLLLFAAAYRVFDSVQIGAGMALRGYKDTRVASAINIAAYWLFGLPLCWTLAMGSPWNAGLGVAGFWIGMLAVDRRGGARDRLATGTHQPPAPARRRRRARRTACRRSAHDGLPRPRAAEPFRPRFRDRRPARPPARAAAGAAGAVLHARARPPVQRGRPGRPRSRTRRAARR